MIDKLKQMASLDVEFSLEKISSKRANWSVGVGDRIVGMLSVVDLPPENDWAGGTAVRVDGRGWKYIRTSPVVNVMLENEGAMLIETEGGMYRLEKV